MSIFLKNKETGEIKKCSIGYSWATALCGWITPLFRRDSLSFCFMVSVNLLLIMLKAGVLQVFLFNFICAYFINGLFIRNLVTRKNYTYTDEESREYLSSKGLLFDK